MKSSSVYGQFRVIGFFHEIKIQAIPQSYPVSEDYNSRFMEGWFHIYTHRRKQLIHYQLAEGSVGADTNDTYILYSKLLIKSWFLWKMLILLIDLYYINQCFLWLAFKSFYSYSFHQLLAFNVVLLLLLFIHIVFKIMMTPKLPPIMFEYLGRRSKSLLYMEHICRYDYNLLNVVIYLLFLMSYWLPYSLAQWIHLIYTFKLIEINSMMQVIYTKIYTSKVLRVLYRIIVLTFVILYISHFIACVFYDIDQELINSEYFGDPINNSQMYYQYSSGSYTPIQMLSEFERYIMALYFGNGLITTIAYGDIVGRNWIEDTYVGIMMIVSTLVVAFLLEEFMIMVEDNRFSIYEIVTNYGHLDNLMTQKKIKETLKLKIRNYILYIEYYNKFRNPKNILSKLTKKMYIDLFEKGYGSYFQQVFSPLGFTNIRKMCYYMEEITYQPQIEIYYPEWKSKQHKDERQIFQTEALKPNLMFLVAGKVYQYVQWQPQCKQFQMRKGVSYMNVFEFIAKRHVRYGVRTKNIVQLVILKYQHFQEILDGMDTFRKEIVIIKQMVLSGSMSRKVLMDDCQVCQDLEHSVLNCPDVHYVIDSYVERGNKIHQVLSEKVHKRQKIKRKQLKSTRAYNLLHYTVIFGNLSIGGPIEEKMEDSAAREVEIGVSYLQKLVTNLFEKAHLEERGHEEEMLDTIYDPEGIDPFWAIQYNPDPLQQW